MMLPISGGFAPNVNVQIQPFEGTISDYVSLSKQQFAQAKLKLLKEETRDKVTAFLEYSGEMQGQALHWYAKAVSNAGRVYLVTATATEDQWNSVAAKLKACVDSLELNKG
jgi:hypothetical protein